MSRGPRNRPPLSPREAWISDGRQVLHFRPLRYDRWSQVVEMTIGELIPEGEPPLLKRRQEMTREEAIRIWTQKRETGWRVCSPLVEAAPAGLFRAAPLSYRPQPESQS